MADNEYLGLTPIEILNIYRNKYYNDGNATEKGIVATAINDILPEIERIKTDTQKEVMSNEN